MYSGYIERDIAAIVIYSQSNQKYRLSILRIGCIIEL